MKSNILKSFFTTLILLLIISVTAHAVPNVMNYTGKLNDQNGVPLTGDYSITFTIYDAATGGNALWTETWNATTKKVSVKDGLFQVELGTYNPLVPTMFDKDNLYLSIKVESDSEMAPRQRFTSGAYAFSQSIPDPLLLYTYEIGDPPVCSGSYTAHSLTVPTGEIWEVYSSWIWQRQCWCWISGLTIKINGVSQSIASDFGGNLGSNGYKNAYYTVSVNPPIKVRPGQTISFETSVSTDKYCQKGMSGAVGLYYNKITP